MNAEYFEDQAARFNKALTCKKIALVDLEATCTDDPALQASWENEVIEVGMVVVDVATQSVDSAHQWYVKPQFTPINGFCTQLTGITPQTVADSPDFTTTMEQVRAFLEARPDITMWGSFGEYDRKQLLREAERKATTSAFAHLPHFNVKAAAQVYLKLGAKARGLDAVIKGLGLRFQGRHHSGVDDARNVAAVFAGIANKLKSTTPTA